MTFGAHYEHRPTEAYPVMQRTGIKFFRKVAQTGRGLFAGIGQRGFFIRDIVRAFGEPATWGRETIKQMRNIGVDSVPLVVIVAGFLGAVTAFQAFYQLFAGVQLSVLGLLVRGSIVLELGPLLTPLVLTGRIGARMTAEIGTMRVTEQIDALTTLSTNPLRYLVLPRLIAGILTLPCLVLVADIIGVFGGFIVATYKLNFDPVAYLTQTERYLATMDVVSGLIKAAVFGFIVALMGCYMGYQSRGGAQGVGQATTYAVVSASILILLTDYFMTQAFFAS